MKKFIFYSISLIGMLVVGVAHGQANSTISKDKKAKVEVVKLKDIIDITVHPPKGYKWNEEFPATLRFSVCNEYECIFVTEKIKIKKD
jgi:hypothetical protein